MTSALLRKRLEKLSPPLNLMRHAAPAIDPRTLETMRDYLEGGFTAEPGTPEPVARAMNDFLAAQ